MSLYKNLTVWQKSMDLVLAVYRLTEKLPREELYCLGSQLRRAVISIPSNIAEGNARQSSKEYRHFLCIARGSNSEVETQLEICLRLGYCEAMEVKTAFEMCNEVGKMLSAIIKKLTTTT